MHSRRIWPALLALLMILTAGVQGDRGAEAQAVPPGLVLARYTDAGLTFLMQTGRDPATLRTLGTLPGMKAPATPAARIEDMPQGLSRGLCAPLDITIVVCLQGRQIIPFDLTRGRALSAIDLPPADDARVRLFPSWTGGSAYVVQTIGDPFGPSAVQPQYRLGVVTVMPAPTYKALGSGDTFRGIQIVGDTGDLRNLIYAIPLGGDPGRGALWLLDRNTGARKGEVWANGDRERGFLGYGPIGVSPDGKWLLVGSGPPFEGSGFPPGQMFAYDLDNPAPPRRGIVFPRDVEPTGILWAPDGTALVSALPPSWEPDPSGSGGAVMRDGPLGGSGGLFRVDPATGAVTELAQLSTTYATPVALSPDGAWAVVETLVSTDDNNLLTQSEAIALNTPPGVPADRFPVGTRGDRVLGWYFQLP